MEVEAIKKRSQTEFCVPIDEEWGRSHMIWFPPFPESEIESRWKSMPGFEGQTLVELLGGDLFIVDDESHFDESIGPSAVRRTYTSAEMIFWESIFIPTRYCLVLCCDQDSYLTTPTGETVFHAGFSGTGEPEVLEGERMSIASRTRFLHDKWIASGGKLDC